MGLRESRIITSVHPWFGARLKWLAEVARLNGGSQALISGNRTREEQWKLYNFQGTRPAAYPGCSQHQYGFAADAVWTPFATITSKGRGVVYSQQETNRIMNEAAAIASLTTVRGDPGHLQVFNGAQFRAHVVSVGLCPASPPPPLWNIAQVQASNDAYRDCLMSASSATRLLGSKAPSFSCPQPCGPLFNRLC